MGEGGDLLREAARAHLEGDEQALGRLLALALDHIDRGVANALRKPDRSMAGWAKVDALEAANAFVDKKLGDPDAARAFCRQLVEAQEDSSHLLVTAARNFALDLLRKRIGGEILLSSGNITSGEGGSEREETAPELETRFAADELHPEAAMAHRELTQHLRGVLAKAKVDDRLLLGAMFAGVSGAVSDEDIAVLAERRGVTPDQIRDELEVRAERWFARERELRDALSKRAREKAMLVHRIHKLEQLCAELRDPPDVRPATGVNVSDYGSRGALDAATPEIRAGILLRRRQMLQQKDEAIGELSKLLAKPNLAEPRYEEVALILGLVDADASEQALKTAANTVTVKWGRVRQRLVAAARAKGGGR